MTTVETRPDVGGAPPAAPAKPRRRGRWHRLDTRLSPYLYVSPFFLLFAVFGLFPLVYTFVVSLHHWELTGGPHPYIGTKNYRELWSDPYFWNALRNTLSIWGLSTVPQLFIALIIAHLLNTRLRMRTFLRMGVLLPNVTSVVAVTIVFSQVFSRDYGITNAFLGIFGVHPLDWRAGTLSSHVAIATMVTWRWTGYNALIYLAAMQAIPRDLYEAAAVDGAGTWRQFRSITIPMLRPTIIFTATISTIGAMQLFAEPFIFSGGGTVTGGSDRQFQTLGLYLYETAYRNFSFGYGAAIAWVMFVLIVIASLLSYGLTRMISRTS